MSIKLRKFISSLIAAIGAILYAVFFSANYEASPNGTVEGRGIGMAIEVLTVWAAIYAIVFFTWARVSKDKDEVAQ